MANAVLTSFPAILRNSDLEEHELKLQWKLRIQRKFQNSRKRQDSFVKEVAARKKKKAPHVEAEETEHPPKPHSENVDSVKIYRQWLALEWLKRDPDLDKVEDLMQLTLSERRNQITNGDISVPEIINLYPWIQSFDGIINEFLRLELHTDEPDPRIAILQGLEKYKLPVTSLLKKRRAVPHYMKTLLELYEHNESEYDCLVTLGLLHLLGERKDSIFTQVPEGELRTRQSSISIQHVGDIHESDRFCILLDGVPVAEPACIAMAVASFVAGHFVFHIDHPKNCEHFLSFASSYLLGIKDGRETTSKSRTLVVKLNEEQTKFSYSNT
ncbi:uncharacterized protein LOC126980989 [Eriocheir sinensis]|uniref:uncharacterized protein LOC126980989 n=1 Tax=Eriocheir sinensis TaxID=95602 RepID=UPI0021C7F465|nr:uncharacterized protein LOC126980989 [Eriocheir sinensis]